MMYLLFFRLKVLRVSLIHEFFHLFEHGFTYVLRVNKVAISSSFTLALIVLSAIGFAKICYRAIFGDDLLRVVIATVLSSETLFSLLFRSKLHIDISHHVFT